MRRIPAGIGHPQKQKATQIGMVYGSAARNALRFMLSPSSARPNAGYCT